MNTATGAQPSPAQSGQGQACEPRDRRPAIEAIEAIARPAAMTLAIAVGVVPIMFIAAAANRGLDLSDEGFYLVTMQRPQLYLESSSQFPLILGVLWDVFQHVYLLRLAKLVLLLLCGVALGRATNTYIDSVTQATRPFSRRFATLLAVTFGALAAYVWIPQTPSYNDIVTVLTYGVAWGVLRLATRNPSPSAEFTIHALFGLCTWTLLLTKWPVGVLLALGLALAYATQWRKWRPLVACVGAFTLAALLTQVFLAPISAIVSGQRTGNRNTEASYETSTLLREYRTSITEMPEWTVRQHPFLTLIVLAAAIVLGVLKTGKIASSIAVMAGLIVPVALLVTNDLPGGNATKFSQTFFAGMLLLFMFILVSSGVSRLGGDRKMVLPTRLSPKLLAGGFLLGPFISAVGTNNSIFAIAVLVTPLWMIGLIVLVESGTWSFPSARICIAAAVFGFGAIIAIVGADATWRHPYRQVPLSQADTRVDGGPLSGLMVDAHLAQAISDLNNAVDLTDPDVVVPIGDLPGLVAATGRPQAVFGWIKYYATAKIDRSLTTACDTSDRVLVLVFAANDEAGLYRAYCPLHTWEKVAQLELLTGTVDTWLLSSSS